MTYICEDCGFVFYGAAIILGFQEMQKTEDGTPVITWFSKAENVKRGNQFKRRNEYMKKPLSFILILCMVLAMIPAMSITASAAAPTAVYVGGTNVIDGANVTYWLNDAGAGGITTGTIDNYNVKYDPNGATLTLSGAAITGNAYNWTNETPVPRNSYAVVFANGDLNLVLSGSNSITGGSEDGDNIDCYGLGIWGSNLNITGAGTLTAIGADISGSSCNSIGLFALENLTIGSGTTVIAKGGTSSGSGCFSMGVLCQSGSLSITDATLQATGDEAAVSRGLAAAGNITITDSAVTATSRDASRFSIAMNSYYKGISISGGNVTAICGSYGNEHARGMVIAAGYNINISSGAAVTIRCSSNQDASYVTASAPVLSSYGVDYKITASSNYDGSSPSTYNASQIINYRYFKIEQKSTAPTASVTSVSKSSATQASVAFTLTSVPAGTYRVYADNTTTTELSGVTAAVSGTTLTLTDGGGNVPTGIYYVAVTEAGKSESDRLALTVAGPPTISINDCSAAEGNSGTSAMTFTVSLDKTWASDITVDYATADNTAAAGSDYVSKSGTLTFPAGTTTQAISVTVNGDAVYESNETFYVNLSNASGGAISDGQGIGTITNDETLPDISINDCSAAEGNSGTSTMTFTVTLNKTSAIPVTVDYATADNTAAAGSDYVSKSGTLTFPAGTTTQAISVTVNGDAVYESNETFYVNLSNASGGAIIDGQGIGTITNDETLPDISINDCSAAEENSGTSTMTFTVTLNKTSAIPVTVDYATADNTAAAGSDYVSTSGSLTFAAGTTTQAISVTINGDAVYESNETFYVNLSNASGGAIIDVQGIGTITNDETLPNISINDCSAAEGNSGTSAMTFTVSLDKTWASDITVDYATADNTAAAGSDYVSKSGTLTFPAGTTTQAISVTVNGDAVYESNETFYVNLSNASGGAISDGQGIGTITNDETLPDISINDCSAAEGNSGTSTMTFTVTLNKTSAIPVTVDYATADNTAAAGSDYVSTSGSLTFAAGTTTQAISVTVNGDAVYESSETFNVNLSNAFGATISDSQGIGTITNDDAAPNNTSGGGGGSSASTVVTKIESGGSVAGTNVDNLVKEGKSLTVEGKAGEKLVFDTEALKTIDGQTKENLKIEIKDVSESHKSELPGRIVFSLTITAGNKSISSFGNGTATVALPYELKAGEKAENVTVWYLAEDGTMTKVPCSYDPVTKLATFKVNHFSLYVVGTADTSKWTNPFGDVKENSWFYDAVRYVSANGMMQGTADTSFNPNGKTTRGMIVTILWRMENQPKAAKEITFTDVKNGKYYHDAVAWASEKGIVGGYSAEQFGPNDNITREQMAVILFNYASYKGYKTQTSAELSGYSDSGSLHKWSKDAMSWANGESLITGTGSNLLNPLGAAERCQVAAILQRFVENTVKQHNSKSEV